MGDKVKDFLEKAKGLLKRLPKKIIIIAAAVLAVVIVAAVVVLGNKPYSVLVTEVSNEEAVTIMSLLDEMGVTDYRLEGNDTILVPESQEAQLKARLLVEGYPKTGFSYENSKEYYNISVSDENVLTMTSASNKDWTDYIGGKPSAEDRKISLQIPDGLLENLTLSTTNEDITLSALSVTESISISCSGGNIAFEALDVGSALHLAVKNGDISGELAGSYDDFAIQSEIKKGESNLPDNKDSGAKLLNVSSNNGDVNIALAGE